MSNAGTTYLVGAHYQVTGSTITKYYYAGSQRIAMRTNGTLNFLLGDHLGSTSLTTDAVGTVISEMRYKAWGEVRYASGVTPTQYQFTGQFSYANDFGLLFYNARWVDPSLGRFVQADSIVPGGVQGLDRYAYTNNNPVAYIDPSGHIPCEYYAGDGCTSSTEDSDDTSDPVSLTNPGDPVPGTGGTQSFGGTQVKKLYELMADCTTCWWYKNGSFTIETFLGLIIMAEANYLQGDPLAMEAIKQIYAQRLYVGGGAGDTDPYCPPGQCHNGVFNYLAATSGSVWKLINTYVRGKTDISGYMGPGSIGQYDGHEGGDPKIKTALNKAVDLGHYALNPSVLYGRKEGPSEYGNDVSFATSLRTNDIPTNKINGLAEDTLYLYFGNAYYFSLNQYYYWRSK